MPMMRPRQKRPDSKTLIWELIICAVVIISITLFTGNKPKKQEVEPTPTPTPTATVAPVIVD